MLRELAERLWLVHVPETPPATPEIDFSPYKKE